MFADEELVMELLVNAGQARSDAMEAIRCAGQKDWQGATQLMASSESACLQAHKIQTALISQDEGCGKIKVNFNPAFTDQAIQHTGQCSKVDRQHFFQFNRSNTRRAADRAEHLKLCRGNIQRRQILVKQTIFLLINHMD